MKYLDLFKRRGRGSNSTNRRGKIRQYESLLKIQIIFLFHVTGIINASLFYKGGITLILWNPVSPSAGEEGATRVNTVHDQTEKLVEEGPSQD